jgi:tetratricopeptide (TPR) repeat protein
VGDALLQQGEVIAALVHYEKSLAIRLRLASDTSDLQAQRDLSLVHDRIGRAHARAGDLEAALVSYQTSLEIAGGLAAADPSNPDLQRELAQGNQVIGDVLMRKDALDAALQAHRSAMVIRERLAFGDPGNRQWRRELLSSYERVMLAEERKGSLAALHDLYCRLAAINPSSDSIGRIDGDWLNRLGLLARRAEREGNVAPCGA